MTHFRQPHFKYSRPVGGPYFRRYFFNFFKKKDREVSPRPGALTPEALAKEVRSIGEGKVVELLRIGFDGQADEVPITVEVLEISDSGFRGRVVNVERQLIEASSRKTVYARRGGGAIDFRFDDGDIKSISISKDADELAAARDVSAIKEIIQALDVNDHILVAYFDPKHRGTVNVEGTLSMKSSGNKIFKIVIEKINGIALEQPLEKQFDIDTDVVVAIDLM